MTSIVEVRGVSLAKGGLQILDDVSFSAEEGAITAVIGPNGAGKTTLFNVASGFMRADRGSVRLAGRELTRLRPEGISRAGLARTFQKVRGLPHLSVLDNVMTGTLATDMTRKEAHELADRLLHRLHLDEQRDVDASALSIGQRKRLGVACVLSTAPRVVLLDEVMGGLIPVEIQQMMGLIRELVVDGLSVLFVEHHMSAVMGLSDHVIVLDRGRVIAEGPPSAISEDRAVIDAYLGGSSDA